MPVPTFTFPNEWHFLQQESFLIHTCITNGLTEIRHANLERKGLFYSAFFNLSIGLERLLKVTLIIHYMQLNNLSCPNTNTVKAYGHDIRKLLNTCQAIADDLSLQCDLTFSKSKIKTEIIELLNGFAQRLRYHNLDSLTGDTKGDGPLETWDKIVSTVFQTEVPIRKRVRIIQEASLTADMLRDITVLMAHDLSKNSLSIDSVVLQSKLIDVVAPYINWHLIEIVKTINKLQFHVATLAQAEEQRQNLSTPKVPFVEEFYNFTYGDMTDHLSKKKWP